MNVEKRIVIAERNLERMLQWIRAADTKIPIFLAIDSSMAAYWLAHKQGGAFGSVGGIALQVGALAPLLLSLFFLLLAALPRLKSPAPSLVFFGTVAEMEIKKYTAALQQCREEEYFHDLVSQCHRNAVIASIKHRFIRLAVVSLFVALPFWLTGIWLL